MCVSERSVRNTTVVHYVLKRFKCLNAYQIFRVCICCHDEVSCGMIKYSMFVLAGVCFLYKKVKVRHCRTSW